MEMKPEATPPTKRKAKRAYVILAIVALAVVGIYYGHGYLTRNKVKTDDAQVDADVTPISPTVPGVVLHLRVTDNQRVEAGQVLAELDPTDYQLKVASAEADLAAAEAQAEMADAQVEIVKSTSAGGLTTAQAQLQGSSASVRTAAAQVDVASAALARAKAEEAKADQDLADAEKLLKSGAFTGQQVDLARTNRDTAHAAVAAAQASLEAAREQQSLSRSHVAEAKGHVAQSAPVDVQIAAAQAAAKHAHVKVDGAKAALALAQRMLEHTKIIAPAAGYVSKLAAHEGQLIQPGTTLLMLVPATTYVIANFKETQIARIRAGDPVDIEIDALDATLHGKVVSVSPGTGARFSLIPPDNATGNFVKVVQRVPVKIEWAQGEDVGAMRAGLSAEVTVRLQH
jgi:membrane fusion protein (multidrug efflux system)